MQFHPHGNVSIEDALVVLQQKRYLIEGQGNFGNIYTGDPAAASRYIECRLTDLARNEIFNDEITRTIPSYDGRNQEPVTLPAKLAAVADARCRGHRRGPEHAGVVAQFLRADRGADRHPPGQAVLAGAGFSAGRHHGRQRLRKGSGKVKLRAVIEPKPHLAGTLVIRELPAGTTTDTLIASIEDAARKKKIRIKSIDDFTAEHVEIEIKLVPGEDVHKTIAALYLFTDCEQTLSVRR